MTKMNFGKNFFETTLHSLGDGVVAADLDGLICYFNQSAERITGWKAEEVLDHKLSGVMKINTEQEDNLIIDIFKEVIANNRTVGLKNNSVLTLKSGEQRYISASHAPIVNENGVVVGLAMVFRDITRIKQYQKELDLERRNFQTLFNTVPSGMVVMEKTAEIIEINSSALKIFHKTKSEAMVQKFGDFCCCIHRRDSDQGCGFGEYCKTTCEINRLCQAVFMTGAAQSTIKMRHQSQLGPNIKSMWLNITTLPVLIANRTVVMLSMNDITIEENAMEEIAKSRDFYLTLFEHFPVLIWRIGLDGQCNYLNQTWFEFTGRPPEEEMGGGWLANVHPQDQEMLAEKFNGINRQRNSFELEYRLKRYDGEYRWMLVAGRPLDDFEGNHIGFIGCCYDITAIRQAELTLSRFRLLSERASDIMLFMNLQGEIVEANEAAVKAYGYSKRELLFKTIFDLRQSDDCDWIKSQIKKAEEESLLFETMHYRKDGTAFPVEVSAGAVTGDQKLVLSVVRDITERKKVETAMKNAKEIAEKANRAKSEFLANMSHEIRTPLNGVIGMTDLTLMTSLSFEQRDNLNIVKNSANVLLNVLNDILDFSKIEAGKLQISKVEFNFPDFINRIIKTYIPIAKDKGLKLNWEIDPFISPVLVGDIHRLQQILANLLNNAIKFTDSGEVSLLVTRTQETGSFSGLTFCISDTGIGISPEEKVTLFEVFSQVDGSITRKYGGTGLGLVIVKRLTEMMGGTVWVESQKGKGSRFYFSIPLNEGCNQPDLPPKPQFPSPVKQNDNRRILLVEDDVVNQAVTTRALEMKGYQVEVANNGREALEVLNHTFDLILMDIQMPELDGIETTRLIRDNKRRIPIIALTAHALKGDRERFLAKGMDDYLKKPIDINELYHAIEKAFERSTDLSINGNKEKKNSVAIDSYPQTLLDLRTQLENAFNLGNLKKIENYAKLIKSNAEEMDEKDIKNLAFKIQLTLRKGRLNEAAEHFTMLNHEINQLIERGKIQ